MILLSNVSFQLSFLIQNRFVFLLKFEKILMKENSKDYEFCINLALDHAKKRINLLENSDKKCVFEEYKEWIQDGLSKHKILLLREDPII